MWSRRPHALRTLRRLPRAPTVREVNVGRVTAVLHERQEVDVQVANVPAGRAG